MLKKDSVILGVALGTVIPVMTYLFLFVITMLINSENVTAYMQDTPYVELACMGVNLVVMRHYLVSLRLDKTGRGLLLVTFIIFFLFFAIFKDLT